MRVKSWICDKNLGLVAREEWEQLYSHFPFENWWLCGDNVGVKKCFPFASNGKKMLKLRVVQFTNLFRIMCAFAHNIWDNET